VLGSGGEGGGGGDTDGSTGSAMAYIHKLVCEFVKLTLVAVATIFAFTNQGTQYCPG
jgi:hypothetical protein